MLRILSPTLASLLLAAMLSADPAAAQQQPAQQSPPSLTGQEGVSRDDPPNWPGGLQDWESNEEREPQGGNPNEAEQRGLTSPEVQRSQDPQPTQQGTRAPGLAEDDTVDVALADLLRELRRAPPGLDGQRIPRPNPLASEPEIEMQPHPEGDIEVLFPENYVE